MPRALVTGSAGFIGFHMSQRLLNDGWQVVGLDCLSDYYDVELKKARHRILSNSGEFRAVIGALQDKDVVAAVFADGAFDAVFHLAAQAGVRHSIDAPATYVASNLVGTFNLLEAMRAAPPAHALMASTSSVYGANAKMPYRETDRAVSQMSFYAATKVATEAMAHSYAHLYDVPVTMFRFFTVYGPWGRPDMAYFKFTKAILEGQPIDVYNQGRMRRDFTYVGDLVEALVRLIPCAPERPGRPEDVAPGDSLSSVAPYRVVNIGNEQPVELLHFIETIEAALGQKAEMRLGEMQPGDVVATWADTGLLKSLTGYAPSTPLDRGIGEFIDWYRSYIA